MCITVLNHVFSGTVTTMARRCCRFFSRGTTLVLLKSGLLSAVHLFLYSAISLSLPHNLKLALEYIEIALFLLLPVTGLDLQFNAESCFK